MKLWWILFACFLLVSCVQSGEGDNTTASSEDVEEIDEEQEVEEAEEEVKPTSRIDLIPIAIADTLYPSMNEENEFTLSVQNLGFQRVEEAFSWSVVLKKEGNTLYEQSGEQPAILMLPTDEERLHEFTHTFTEEGDHELVLTVDTENDVAELKEDNNVKTITLRIVNRAEDDDDDSDDDDDQPVGLIGDDAREEVEEAGCYDSDEGKAHKILGTCFDSNFVDGRNDFCLGSGERLAEGYCNGVECDFEIKKCTNVCREGKCL